MRNKEKVGYKNPPKKSQFKKGKSGNPSGRPKGSKSFAPLSHSIHDLRKMLVDTAFENINARIDGKEASIHRIKALCLQMYNKAMTGNNAASALVIKQLTDAMIHLEQSASKFAEITREDRIRERQSIFTPPPRLGTVGEIMHKKHKDFSENFICRQLFGEDAYPPISDDEPLTEEDWVEFNKHMRDTYLFIGNHPTDKLPQTPQSIFEYMRSEKEQLK